MTERLSVQYPLPTEFISITAVYIWSLIKGSYIIKVQAYNYRIAGYFRGENFHELSYSQLFKGKIFTNRHGLQGVPIAFRGSRITFDS